MLFLKLVLNSLELSQENPRKHHIVGKLLPSVDECLTECLMFTENPIKHRNFEMLVLKNGLNHAVYSEAINKFVKEFDPESIQYTSDNRLADDLPEKLGFKFDFDLSPECFWWKNHKRYPENFSETVPELLESTGYKKIWDLGKKRWILNKAEMATPVAY